MSTVTQALERLTTVGQRFLGGFEISASVGEWSRGATNSHDDVVTIQLLLEFVAKKTGRPEYDPQGIDGKISRTHGKSGTVKAIRAFQRRFLSSPDGVVEPGLNTHLRLKAEVSADTPKSSDASRSVMKSPQFADGMPDWLRNFGWGGFSSQPSVPLLPAVQSPEPSWISIAEKELGVTEDSTKGKHNARIIEYHATTNQSKKDETPWCASFVNWVVQKAGYEGAGSAWSHAWKRWGDKAPKPAIGAVAFIDWGLVYPDKEDKKGTGHVGFVVGKTKSGRIVLLGGNQKDKVRYSAFRKSHIVAYRVPKGYTIDEKLYELPVLDVEADGGGFSATR